MTNKTDLTRINLISASLLAATLMFAQCTPSAAQEGSVTNTDFSAQQQQQKKKKSEQKKAAPAGRPAPHRAAPQRAIPRVAAPQRREPRTVTQQKATSRAVTQQKASPRVVTVKGTKSVTASRLRGVPARGAGRFTVRGQNYSAWRSGYRRRHGNGWWTFVALSTLGAIAIGSDQYYPYAYISAPQDYCEGLTEDGCQLMWQDVQTEEGDAIDQCIAYCPWQ
jgi:hypothetical protein